MAAKDTSVSLIASSQTESERQSPFRLEQVRGELAGSRSNPQNVCCPTEFEPLLSEIDAGRECQSKFVCLRLLAESSCADGRSDRH